MPIDYVAKIRENDAPRLLAMLRRVREDLPIPGWRRGKAFEHIILRAFELEGIEVKWPYTVTMEGRVIEQIDGVVYADGLSCLIEAKDYADPIAIEPIAKLRNQLMRRPSPALGLLFSRTDFSIPAKLLTRMMNPLNILLWEGEELQFSIEHRQMREALQNKYRYAVEYGFPDFNIMKAELQ